MSLGNPRSPHPVTSPVRGNHLLATDSLEVLRTWFRGTFVLLGVMCPRVKCARMSTFIQEEQAGRETRPLRLNSLTVVVAQVW